MKTFPDSFQGFQHSADLYQLIINYPFHQYIYPSTTSFSCYIDLILLNFCRLDSIMFIITADMTVSGIRPDNVTNYLLHPKNGDRQSVVTLVQFLINFSLSASVLNENYNIY